MNNVAGQDVDALMLVLDVVSGGVGDDVTALRGIGVVVFSGR